MYLVSFLRPDGSASYGTTDGTTIHDFGAELGHEFKDLRAVIAGGAVEKMKGEAPTFSLTDVTLLPPIPNPDKILCIGMNYMSHIKETGRDKPKFPSIFTRYPSSIVGHGVPLVRPKASDKFDYEGELAVIIGKTCRHVPESEAFDVIAGYTCFNDGSIRDYQIHTSQFWPGKSFEASGSMGPWLVTRDEVADIGLETLTTYINGNVEQQAKINDLAITIPEMIAYISTVITLSPGDVIATGTPGGVGRFREPQLYLEPGMTADVEVTGIGTLSNSIVDE
ncbi:fumarylacetoacetate hydrolase family protein [Halioxenophilus sp. WMMB6]|uniref:fumarylacetoacetate hydrolase family protein n=1 Tax=Halioxenophilus sp. WMMB6 TaxID=3073815 RepID=UPI00295E99B0|nr:fumarylacetoacetate hydrolase family protein [Halioxenophilus sp. WMMB6]